MKRSAWCLGALLGLLVLALLPASASAQCIPYDDCHDYPTAAVMYGVCADDGNGCRECVKIEADCSISITWEEIGSNHLVAPSFPWEQPELARPQLVLHRDGARKGPSCANPGLFRRLDRRPPRSAFPDRPLRTSIVPEALGTTPAL